MILCISNRVIGTCEDMRYSVAIRKKLIQGSRKHCVAFRGADKLDESRYLVSLMAKFKRRAGEVARVGGRGRGCNRSQGGELRSSRKHE